MTQLLGTQKATGQRPLPPSVKGLPIIGPLPMMTKDFFGFITEARETYGDAYTLNFGPTKAIILNHPRHVEHVFLRHATNYSKGGPMWATIRDLIGNGLASSEGDFWRKQRRMIQPQFHHQRIAGLANLMMEAIDEGLADWDIAVDTNQSIDAEKAFSRITMKVIVKTMFGTGLNNEEADKVGNALTYALDYILKGVVTNMLPSWLPAPGRKQYQTAIDTIDEIVFGVIERRQQSGEEGDDLISLLLSAVDEESGQGMSKQQLRDEAVTMFLAGYETTATALKWAFYVLKEQPDIVKRLYDEIDLTLGDRTPTFADLRNLPYPRRVFQEALRLFPPAWWLMRTAVEDDEIDGYRIPAGTIVTPIPYTIHRHPDFWPEAEKFDPDRFTPERLSGQHKQAWVPFGAGQRMCIGREFALMEGQLILTRIFQKYRLLLSPEPNPTIDTGQMRVSTIIKSKDPILLDFSPRS
ncbi:MAG: cytochrome P450 [Chloroflexota bacterium]